MEDLLKTTLTTLALATYGEADRSSESEIRTHPNDMDYIIRLSKVRDVKVGSKRTSPLGEGTRFLLSLVRRCCLTSNSEAV